MRSWAAFQQEALFRPEQEVRSAWEALLEQAVRLARVRSAQAEQEAPLAWAVPFLSVVPQVLSAPAVFPRAFPAPSADSEHPASEVLPIRSAWALPSALGLPILVAVRFPAPRLSAVLPLKLAGQAFRFLPFPQSESQLAFHQQALQGLPYSPYRSRYTEVSARSCLRRIP